MNGRHKRSLDAMRQRAATFFFRDAALVHAAEVRARFHAFDRCMGKALRERREENNEWHERFVENDALIALLNLFDRKPDVFARFLDSENGPAALRAYLAFKSGPGGEAPGLVAGGNEGAIKAHLEKGQDDVARGEDARAVKEFLEAKRAFIDGALGGRKGEEGKEAWKRVQLFFTKRRWDQLNKNASAIMAKNMNEAALIAKTQEDFHIASAKLHEIVNFMDGVRDDTNALNGRLLRAEEAHRAAHSSATTYAVGVATVKFAKYLDKVVLEWENISGGECGLEQKIEESLTVD